MDKPLKFIHLLYAPTNFCNMGCKYCYLGDGTDERSHTDNALTTLKHTIEECLKNNVVPFNLSFHGGEATAIPRAVLAELLAYSKQYYQDYAATIKAANYPLNPVHIKTNLYNFDRLVDLFSDYQVSISGSVDLPLSLHEKYRTTKKGGSTLRKIKGNLKLLATYAYHKKISCVVTQEHMAMLDDFIADINYIHDDIGLDMTKFNIMFSFDSHKNTDKFTKKVAGTEMLTQQQQVEFYRRLTKAFTGTALEEGLKNHWFKEFTPEFCCSAVNCGDKFFLLQSNGNVFACPRGQASTAFFYGNVFEQSIPEILNRGWQTIEAIENRLEADTACFQCEYLPYCNQGCVFVRDETTLTKSYTCLLQKELYRDNPTRYPPYSPQYIEDYAKQYQYKNDFQQIKDVEPTKLKFITPELYDDDHALSHIVLNDPVLPSIYTDLMAILEIDGVDYSMLSPILSNSNELALLTTTSHVLLKIRRDLFQLHCKDPVNNYVSLMLLRNTLVTYGDENRSKQEHIVDYNIYQQAFETQAIVDDKHFLVFDLTAFFQLHKNHFMSGIRNNLYITTKVLREYHYAKQKKNGFYHIQAINLPFPFIEFYWQEDKKKAEEAPYNKLAAIPVTYNKI